MDRRRLGDTRALRRVRRTSRGTGAKWSRRAAWADLDGVVHAADVGPWPVWEARLPLVDFLAHPGKPLSARAASGFLRRTQKGSLRFPAGFVDELTAYAQRVG